MAATSADFGLIGLAVMGENLALNVESRGYKVAVFNRTTDKVDEFINGKAKGKNFIGCHSIEELVKKVKKPRKIMMMVKAGKAVDDLDLAIRQIRQAIFELHTEDPGESLLGVLRAIAESYAASLGFVPDVTVSRGLGPLPEQLRADHQAGREQQERPARFRASREAESDRDGDDGRECVGRGE